MEGLLFESSLTTRFHFLNAARGQPPAFQPGGGLRYHAMDFSGRVPHLALYDVAYYVSYTEEAPRKPLNTGWSCSGRRPPSRCSPCRDRAGGCRRLPAFVWAGEGPSSSLTDWYDDLTLLDRWMVREGPDGWPGSRRSMRWQRGASLRSGGGERHRARAHRISFHTTAVGVPHLVKVSYFPNWRAITPRVPTWPPPAHGWWSPPGRTWSSSSTTPGWRSAGWCSPAGRCSGWRGWGWPAWCAGAGPPSAPSRAASESGPGPPGYGAPG